MNILILVITITWSFGISAHPAPSQKIIVSSLEEAAIYIYNDRPLPYQVESDQKTYTLYEINLEKKTIKEIPIPKISFELPKENEDKEPNPFGDWVGRPPK